MAKHTSVIHIQKSVNHHKSERIEMSREEFSTMKKGYFVLFASLTVQYFKIC